MAVSIDVIYQELGLEASRLRQGHGYTVRHFTRIPRLCALLRVYVFLFSNMPRLLSSCCSVTSCISTGDSLII